LRIGYGRSYFGACDVRPEKRSDGDFDGLEREPALDATKLLGLASVLPAGPFRTGTG